MAGVSWIQRLYWRYLSKPVAHRALYLHAMDTPIGSILELGMGSGERIRTVLGLCRTPEATTQLRYAAVDPFESAGTDVPHISLKGAHRLLNEFGVKAHLIPGEPASGVMRVAHTVLPSDLIIIDGFWNEASENGGTVAKWLPRLCHSRSAIFASTVKGGNLVRVPTPSTASEQNNATKAA